VAVRVDVWLPLVAEKAGLEYMTRDEEVVDMVLWGCSRSS
jgi:hypothetical protein